MGDETGQGFADVVDELLPDVLSGAIEPELVFDLIMPLDQVSDAYAAMDQRRAIKVLLEP